MARPIRIEYLCAVYHAHVAHGYLLKEIADYLKIHYTNVSKKIARETEGRM